MDPLNEVIASGASLELLGTRAVAARVLQLSRAIFVSGVGSDLLGDLLNPGSDHHAPEPYDADRLFRIAVLDEGWPVAAARVLYSAAQFVLEDEGVF